jgi:nucleotide-binding universal stress UspA family protein
MKAVLVPLDGSPFSERALPVAAWMAGRLGGGLSLVSAIDSEDERAARSEYLSSVAATFGEAGVPAAWSVVVDRDRAGAIHESRRQLDDAVVCLATHGRGASAALVGSVATEVVARGHDSLVLVGPLLAEKPVGTGVVACVSGGPETPEVLGAGVAWGEWLDEPVVAAMVAEPVPDPVGDRPAHRLFGPDGDVAAELTALVASVAPPDADLRGEVVWDPISAADGVVSFVEDHPAALVVIGARVHHVRPRAVFGHTSATIIHRCPNPVLILPRFSESPPGP